MPGQSEVNARERELVIDLREALPPTGNPSPAALQALRQTAARLRVINGQFYRASQLILARSQAVDAPVPEPIRRDLLNQAHAIYGNCVRAPGPGRCVKKSNGWSIESLEEALRDVTAFRAPALPGPRNPSGEG